VAAELRRAGYETAVLDLTGLVGAVPFSGEGLIQAIARSASGRSAILIGHSRAGPLLAAAGVMAGDSVRGCVFVDARLPAPGEAWMETVPSGFAVRLRGMADREGWLPPWPQWWGEDELVGLIPDPVVRESFVAGCPRVPLAMLEQVYRPAPRWRAGPAAYLQLSEAYAHEAATARELGWPVATVVSHHLALLTDPGRIARALHDLISELPG
jgi:pimeloyl-ACP methyl ester carboxylesterase